MDLSKLVAVVTGGASGLGAGTVRNLVNSGAKVAIFDLQEELGTELAGELGEAAIFCKTDVTDEASVTAALDQAVERFGYVNTLVNCAGIGVAEKTMGKKGPHSLKSFSKVLEVNLIGTFNMIRLTAERMSENTPNENEERGVIVNTASVAAYDGQIGQAAYSASKGGIVGMTLPIARDLSSVGVRVVTIAPGLFDTPAFQGLPEKAVDALGKMTPFPSRLGKASEFGCLVNSIIINPMLNGETIRLDGAIRMQPR
ncbi:3-hydroxyacyl-CoA dehydrogenase [Planococcus kocurii]|uniref:3-hydroxy-2-methylbutyryl-CoA dehydrogenase n=1 Tax=Planococcus kocurii TaxID=1374 RepID=A0ABM5WTU6_9BACL|nr:3-hydroxyacyl-CoA dehydrogenase [Planococcus kocurii]ALS77617.1 3-hydroxy-2-methylbutyryl-CoA dehydrogenase [Planococcus kocurii]